MVIMFGSNLGPILYYKQYLIRVTKNFNRALLNLSASILFACQVPRRVITQTIFHLNMVAWAISTRVSGGWRSLTRASHGGLEAELVYGHHVTGQRLHVTFGIRQQRMYIISFYRSIETNRSRSGCELVSWSFRSLECDLILVKRHVGTVLTWFQYRWCPQQDIAPKLSGFELLSCLLVCVLFREEYFRKFSH